MVIFLNLDGSAEKVSPQRLFQGSNNVTNVDVIAPFSSLTALNIGFIRPDGTVRGYFPMEYVTQSVNPKAAVWTFKLPFAVLNEMGELSIAINAVTVKGNTTSYLCVVTVEESVLPYPQPEPPDPDAYDYITLYLQRLEARTAEIPALVKDVYATGTNEFKYKTQSGIESAPVYLPGVGGGTVAYRKMAAYKGDILAGTTVAGGSWSEVFGSQGTLIYYSVVIPAYVHGQMEYGADNGESPVLPDELSIDFDLLRGDMNGNYLEGFAPEWAKDADGDITVRCNAPLALAIRVWNGRGIKGDQGIQGEQGDKGDPGNALKVDKFYTSVADMEADLPNVDIDTTAMIQTDAGVEDEDNAKIYECQIFDGVKRWVFISDLSGATGATPDIQAQAVGLPPGSAP
ncbi:MAG: hypothetical protein LBS99_00630, partial [Clostridiales bacterium]|nr:hypothetical protein [Clostridiales bacterium]